MEEPSHGAVLSTPPAPADLARAHFAGRLSVETDASDVNADAQLIGRAFTLVDVRSAESWDQGRIPGAVHLPGREIAARAADGTLAALAPPTLPLVVYCWGPGCNGAAKAAFAFAGLGYRVKELLGGFEYWAREGYAYENHDGVVLPPPDALTAPVSAPVPVPAASQAAQIPADCGC